MSDTPLLLSVKQVQERTGYGRSKVFELIKTGAIESVKDGKYRRIPTVCLDEYVARLREQQEAA